ncbi:MAG: iron-containing alcohol dehydrogenase [bacterium]|nr:iron-containing alcohol dehydrogenase [bacterium]
MTRQQKGAQPDKINSDSSLIKYTQIRCKIERKSDILFGRSILFNNKWMSLLLHKKSSQHFIITDETVEFLYGNYLFKFLKSFDIDVKILTVPVGEKSKSINIYRKLSSKILAGGIDENSYIIGFGGGVVNNIAGFLASTLYRGIGLIQIPTTLLAQVDAALDFKQAINGPNGKNHIGSYYSADLIVIDSNLLQTLPDRQLKNGFAESIKHALTQDSTFYLYIKSYKGHIDSKEFIDEVITRTINLKIILLNNLLYPEYSEFLLQYGHPIGHALEQLSNYSLLHGEAIAVGMCITSEIALLKNICDKETRDQHYKIMNQFDLPNKIPHNISDVALLSSIQSDKHFIGGYMKSALVSNVGRVYCHKSNGYVFSIENDIIRLAIRRNRSWVNNVED